MQMLDVLKQELDANTRLIGTVRPEQYGGATPCTDMDTRALINHMVMANYFIASCGDPSVTMPEGADATAGDPAEAYEQGAATLIKTFGSAAPDTTFNFPFGAMPAEFAIGLAVTETITHRWDLAKACGCDHGIDPQLAAQVLEGARIGISDDLRVAGGPFGPEVQVPDDAPPVDRLVAFLGRTP